MGLQVIPATSVMVFMMVTIASAGDFRPVTEIPMPETGVIDPLAEKVEFETSITPDDGDGGGFIAALAGPLHRFPCPVVIWAAPEVKLKDLVAIPDDKEDAFKEMERFFWQVEKRTKELQASGLIGTSTGDRIQEGILNDLKARREEIEKDFDRVESVPASEEIVSSTKTNEGCQESFTKTWADVLDTIKHQSAPYTVNQHKGFTEIAWGSKESIESFIRNKSKEVPPIAFIASLPEQFLPMWQTVSGLTIEYDPVLLEKPKLATEEKEDLPESVAEDMACGNEEEEKGYESDEVLTVTRTLPIQEFMDLLASTVGGAARYKNGIWKIGAFVGDATGERAVRNILAELKASPYGFGTAEERLVKIGLPALPFILKEFETAEDYYLSALTGVLATMDAPERDAAFLSKLRIGSATGDQFLEDRFDSTMMHVLAYRGVKEVIPIITKYATQDRRSNIDARICLNILDAPLPASDPASLLVVGSTQEEEFKKSDLAVQKEILFAAIDQCWDGQTPLRLCEIRRDEKGTVSFGGPRGEHGETWEFRIGKPVKDKVSVSHTWYDGPLAAEGHEGYAEKKNGRWLFTKWWMNWIS